MVIDSTTAVCLTPIWLYQLADEGKFSFFKWIQNIIDLYRCVGHPNRKISMK